MTVDFDDATTASGDASVSSSGGVHSDPAPKKPSQKKKRSLPGMPDPDSEVIALSPKTLMATNIFVCEICNKGFPRDQNLQLHKRGHNLPWTPRQRSNEEVRKRVYVCPELGCVYHDPARALGDLSGIKKHFCRKHGEEKKWKCEKCEKKYAVRTDWKAHSRICGSREYKCDFGTLFSRRDREFCDVLAEESVRSNPDRGSNKTAMDTKSPKPKPLPSLPLPSQPPPLPALSQPPPEPSPPPPPVAQAAAVLSPILPIQRSVLELIEDQDPSSVLEEASPPVVVVTTGINSNCSNHSNCTSVSSGNTSSIIFDSLFASSTTPTTLPSDSNPRFSDPFNQIVDQPARPPIELPPSLSSETLSLCLATNHGSSIFASADQECWQYGLTPQPTMSATTLLQKAAQIGSAVNCGSLLRGLGLELRHGLMPSSPSSGTSENLSWTARQVKPEDSSLTSGLGQDLHCDDGSGFKELMIESPSMSSKHPTLDFLGLGTAAGAGLVGSPNGSLSASLTSISGELDMAASFRGGECVCKDFGRSS